MSKVISPKSGKASSIFLTLSWFVAFISCAAARTSLISTPQHKLKALNYCLILPLLALTISLLFFFKDFSENRSDRGLSRTEERSFIGISALLILSIGLASITPALDTPVKIRLGLAIAEMFILTLLGAASMAMIGELNRVIRTHWVDDLVRKLAWDNSSLTFYESSPYNSFVFGRPRWDDNWDHDPSNRFSLRTSTPSSSSTVYIRQVTSPGLGVSYTEHYDFASTHDIC